jgi:hypothetical protein
MKRINELGTTSAVSPSSLILLTLIMEAIISSETQFLEESHGVTSVIIAVFVGSIFATAFAAASGSSIQQGSA